MNGLLNVREGQPAFLIRLYVCREGGLWIGRCPELMLTVAEESRSEVLHTARSMVFGNIAYANARHINFASLLTCCTADARNPALMAAGPEEECGVASSMDGLPTRVLLRCIDESEESAHQCGRAPG